MGWGGADESLYPTNVFSAPRPGEERRGEGEADPSWYPSNLFPVPVRAKSVGDRLTYT